jgi:hypothetical protein
LIRLKGFATLVPDTSTCASACAIAWLGGAKRLAGHHASIGFHAASQGRGGPETGLGNALLGAYLNQIGLPDTAIVFITVASPQSMMYLDFETARKIGIDVIPFEMPPTPAAPAPSTPPTQPQAQTQPPKSFEDKTREFVADLIERSAGLELQNYPENVSYYGKLVTRAAVMEDKRRFNERWPQRRYIMDAANVQCLPPNAGSTICDVSTRGRWWTSNGQKTGSGTVTGTYRIQWLLNLHPKILVETSVAARDPAPAPPAAQPETTTAQTPEWVTSFFKMFLQ